MDEKSSVGVQSCTDRSSYSELCWNMDGFFAEIAEGFKPLTIFKKKKKKSL